MPSKFVFPGGRVDAQDADVPLASEITPEILAKLDRHARPGLAHALLVAAIRELWEEAGLRLCRPGTAVAPSADWTDFFAGGHIPDARPLRFFFRAITPPGRPRRFDARFFIADATQVTGDPDDFSAADDELRHLCWLPLQEARKLDLPFITEVVLAEVAARLSGDPAAPHPIPFLDHTGTFSRFRSL